MTAFMFFDIKGIFSDGIQIYIAGNRDMRRSDAGLAGDNCNFLCGLEMFFLTQF